MRVTRWLLASLALAVVTTCATAAEHAAKTTGAQAALTMSDAEKAEGFVSLFDGTSFDAFIGPPEGYTIKDGAMICSGANFMYTKEQFGDFDLRFDYRVPVDGNSGMGIRAPDAVFGKEKDKKTHPSFHGMEIQILDDDGPKWKDLEPWQFTGAVYGVIAPERGHVKPANEWNAMEIVAQGPKLKISVNGVTILDANLNDAPNPTPDHHDHPGLKSPKGHFVILTHMGDGGDFRNIRVKRLSK